MLILHIYIYIIIYICVCLTQIGLSSTTDISKRAFLWYTMGSQPLRRSAQRLPNPESATRRPTRWQCYPLCIDVGGPTLPWDFTVAAGKNGIYFMIGKDMKRMSEWIEQPVGKCPIKWMLMDLRYICLHMFVSDLMCERKSMPFKTSPHYRINGSIIPKLIN